MTNDTQKPVLGVVRTRVAPSPTGLLHVGTARATLFSYLFAKRYGGAFILRFEDTDKERSKIEFEDNIIEGLKWLGLSWDEGPYRQSERTELYKKYLLQLLDEGRAFYCTHSAEELEAERTAQMERKEPLRHECGDRDAKKTSGIIRLKNDATGTVTVHDLIRGDVHFNAALLGDFAIAKTPENVLFHFAVVVDDEEMNISHVIRGEDHLPNTPKHILIQQALGFKIPQFGHFPLLLGTDRSKLSKRHGATSINTYREEGYLPEAIINFIALLGWNPGDDREIFSLGELEKEFSLEKVQKGGAVFNIEKLNWLNAEYIKKMPPLKLGELLRPFLEKNGIATKEISSEYMAKVARVEQPRLKTLGDIKENSKFFFEDPVYDPNLLRWKGTQELEEIEKHVVMIDNILCDVPPASWTGGNLTSLLMPVAEEHGKGNVLWPLRVLLSGQKASPGPIEIMNVIGKDATLRRVQKAKELIHE